MIKNPNIRYICIHHTAVSRASGLNQLTGVNNHHRNKWGAKSSLGWYVAYNRFIDVDGTVTKCRAIGEETIANIGHNCDVKTRCDTVSVCVAGSFNIELLNDKEIASLKAEIESLQALYPKAKLVFHKEIQANRTCAGSLFTHDYLNKRILGIGVDELDEEDTEKAKEIGKLVKKLSLLQLLLKLIKMLKLKT